MQRNYLRDLPQGLLALIKDIGGEADRNNLDAYAVGGFVRDIFLGKENLDLDVVIVGEAIPLARRWAEKRRAQIRSYDRFGTATVFLENRYRVDFSSARRETYPSPGCLPKVEKGSIQDDLFRRDFTINALAVSMNKKSFGALIDFFSGQEDLAKGKIRVLHQESFTDDPTRILRAVRFEQRFQFRLERQTACLLKKAAGKKAFLSVKPERYFAEFKKILMEKDPQRYLRRLNGLGELRFLGLKSAVDFHLVGRVEKRRSSLEKESLGNEEESWWIIFFMALVHHESKRNVARMTSRFNFKSVDRKKLKESQEIERLGARLAKPDIAPSQIYRLLRSRDRESVLFLWLTSTGKNVQKNIRDYFLHYEPVKLYVDGYDLMKLGVEGERVGKMLKYILDKKINGCLRTRDDEWQLAKRLTEKER
ncbi:MAG: hypothetical protein WC552_05445 [Candidatus Omnitrophota bacterium]